MTFRICRRVWKCGAAAQFRTKIFFIAFLDELGNFKHFEPYLFFWSKVRQSAAAQCGKVRTAQYSVDECGKGLENLEEFQKWFSAFYLLVAHPGGQICIK